MERNNQKECTSITVKINATLNWLFTRGTSSFIGILHEWRNRAAV